MEAGGLNRFGIGLLAGARGPNPKSKSRSLLLPVRDREERVAVRS